ncbi:beta-galactosidase [Paenibacillus swuensis]|uniref:Beta-galactosidase n=1 Tax=Paenibacillus swuensis TaxID=1178515 RepID=A0A172TQ48_9BACL|nr:alpha-amylase family protein [Paenibacillus swuensis]ANE49112.1 beta-galactosidase [Paenibacillus swuensis]
MRFRQIHLDFHTSEAIANIGEQFNKDHFQAMLQAGHVDSITVFAKCHHGWAYHPTENNEMHPGLSFDLLGAMIEAAHEIDVKTPVYISAGLDEKLARRQPDWLIRDMDDRTNWVSGFMTPGYHQFCFNTPYLDILISQIEEVVSRYDANGVFLDIVGIRNCYCQYCVASVRQEGSDPRDSEAMVRVWERTYANYTDRVRRAVDKHKPGLNVFHNGGHIRRGRRDLADMNTHLELESLPTGGWGYDHFPLSARYAQQLGLDLLGMTGKFHTTWGEFGGYKHPNALRYETALCLANGSRCSIGDQLHPNGYMDPATYELIGMAYAEVQAKEAWCADVTNVADVALLSLEATVPPSGSDHEQRTFNADAGAVRILLEGKVLFDVVDKYSNFNMYKVLILPDGVALEGDLLVKVEDFLSGGGKVLATGRSGLNGEGNQFAIDLGVRWLAENSYQPDYYRPSTDQGYIRDASYVMYGIGQRIQLTESGSELGHREDPYFNREIFTFCSHLHTPSRLNDGGPAVVESVSGIYMAWDVFEDYAIKGSLILREMVMDALNRLLQDKKTLRTSLPAQGITTLQRQGAKNRYIHHLLYASPVRRGTDIEVIEDIVPLYNIQSHIRVNEPIKRIYTAPNLSEITFEQMDGVVTYSLPQLECHQMVVLEY